MSARTEECLANVCQDGGVLRSQPSPNETKPPRRPGAPEEAVIGPDGAPVFPPVPPDTQPGVSSPSTVRDVPAGLACFGFS